MGSRFEMGSKARVIPRLLWRVGLPFCLVSLLAGACSTNMPDILVSPTVPAWESPTDTRQLLPDLAIRGVTVLSDSPNGCPSADEILRMIVQIENLGEAPAGQFVVKLDNDQQLVHNGLAVGQILALTFPGYDSFPQIWVDATSLVVERNESNNQYFQGLERPTPGLACAFTPTPEIPREEATFVLEGHSAGVLSVAFSPDGNTIASGSVDDTLRLWSAKQGRLIRTMQGHPFPIGRLKFSPNGATLFTGSTDGVVRAWRVSSGSLEHSFKGHNGRITGLDVSRDGVWLASSAEDFTVRIWRLPNGVPVQVIDEGMAEITCVVFTPDSQAVAWGEVNGTIRIRTLKGVWLQTLKNTSQPVTSLDISADGELLAAGYADGLIRIWRMQDGYLLQTLGESQAAVTALTFSPDGGWLIAASEDNNLRLWQFDGTQFQPLPVRIMSGHAGPVNSVDFSPQGGQIVSVSDDGTVRIWKLPGE
jgi:WD40 repeat protein